MRCWEKSRVKLGRCWPRLSLSIQQSSPSLSKIPEKLCLKWISTCEFWKNCVSLSYLAKMWCENEKESSQNSVKLVHNTTWSSWKLYIRIKSQKAKCRSVREFKMASTGGGSPPSQQNQNKTGGEVREELVGKRFLLVAGPTNSKPKLSRIGDWQWKAGVIRCASHNDNSDPELQVQPEETLFHFTFKLGSRS